MHETHKGAILSLLDKVGTKYTLLPSGDVEIAPIGDIKKSILLEFSKDGRFDLVDIRFKD